ncbi:MAG: hypothetical protein PHO12_09390 [Bacteroidales bacterium]|nr:hypothetical protein [Bacteroidales bacterium]MDD4683993.1 hypothetical protein [Bacteroidales bacterium]
MKKHFFLGILFSILSFSAYPQVDTISSMIIGSEIFLEQRFEDILNPDTNIAKSSPLINCDSIIHEYNNALVEIQQRKNEIDKMDSDINSMKVEIIEMDSLLIVYDEKTKDLSFQLANLQYKYKEDSIMFTEEIDELKTNEYNLKQINDTLAKLNQEYRNQLNEKNRLLEEKIKIFQEKELLFAEKEQVYKDAISSSNLDKVKIEGLVNASNEKIVGKEKEIDLLQRSINEKESAMASKDLTLNKITEEKEMYYKMADTLRSKLVEAEKQILRTNEELKYTKQRAAEAEAKIAAATNKKKKVRVLQGIAMRFFPTPNWDIVPKDNGSGGYENIIINRNSSKVEFDFVTGASVMLLDLTKPEAKFTSDIGVYVGFGGANMFKNFYFGGAYRFLDFFSVSAGVNVAEYTLLAKDFNKEGDALKPGWSIQTTKEWKVTPFICLSLDLEFLSYMGKK